MKANFLNTEYTWKYAGKCRCCGITIDWDIIKKPEVPSDYADFYTLVQTHNFPQWLEFCENCNHMTVFDLIALSKEPE